MESDYEIRAVISRLRLEGNGSYAGKESGEPRQTTTTSCYHPEVGATSAYVTGLDSSWSAGFGKSRG